MKETKLQTLQKKCANIEEKLKEHRSTRRQLKTRFNREEKSIEEVQLQIGKQNEAINGMEHNNTEHKNLKEPLEALVSFIEKMDSMLREEKDCLPGSILLGAAFARCCCIFAHLKEFLK